MKLNKNGPINSLVQKGALIVTLGSKMLFGPRCILGKTEKGIFDPRVTIGAFLDQIINNRIIFGPNY